MTIKLNLTTHIKRKQRQQAIVNIFPIIFYSSTFARFDGCESSSGPGPTTGLGPGSLVESRTWAVDDDEALKLSLIPPPGLHCFSNII